MHDMLNPSEIDRSRLRWDMEQDGITLLPLNHLHELTWRDTDDPDFIELWLPREQRWRKLRSVNWVPFLVPLAERASLPDVRRRAAEALVNREPAQVKFLMGRILGSLRRWGYIEFVLPEMEARLSDGRYVIERELGRGGMGIVWLARDTHADGAQVAIKHAWNGAGRLASRERLLREEHMLMGIFDHAGIVKAKDAFVHDGRFHLVREFLDAAPLPKMDPERRADPALRVSIAVQIARTLEHMLDRGYMYLDLKPSNYFVDSDGVVTLGDLGMCKPFQDGDRVVRGHIGTYAYAAPEMYTQSQTDERGLVYAMGLLLWELVTRQSPKPKADPARLLARIGDGVLPQERAFLEAALRRDPATRPATVQAAREMLE